MMRLAMRIERLARQLPPLPRPVDVSALQEAWCKRHDIDPGEALEHLRQGGAVLVLRPVETGTNAAAMADWPGPRVVILPPLEDE